MPKKSMKTVFFKSLSPPNSPARSIPPSSPSHRTFSESLMEENIEIAQSLIAKWDSDTSIAKITSLFHDDFDEAKQYLHAVKELQNTMRYFVKVDPTSDKLIRAQNLMQKAMKRLEREFYMILSSNRQHLDPESISARSSKASTRSSVTDYEEDFSEDEYANEAINETERVSIVAMSNLKAIADCMISSGYGKECVKIYRIIRKSIVDEGLYHLGIERLIFNQVQKMDWEVLEIKIKSWLNAVKVAVRTLFYGERVLCDNVFSNSENVRESIFADIIKEGALSLFEFPELVGKCKKTPEKMFRTLDLYEAISDLWPDIESTFSSELTLDVRSQALNSLIKLRDAVRLMLIDFETAIQKDSSKSLVPSGSVHPLTRYVMNYISFLSDYSGILEDIVADWPLILQSPSPEAYIGNPESEDGPSSVISVRLTWLILVLLCKLDGKAELYKNVALSYLFLANNVQYIISKVRSSNLKFLLGEGWIKKHESKLKQYASNFERMGWSKVLKTLPENPRVEMSPDLAKEVFKRFNLAFEEACKEQVTWIVLDPKLREQIKISLARKLAPAYRGFYETHRDNLGRASGLEFLVRFAPDDLENYLSDILHGTGCSSSISSLNGSSHARPRRDR